MRPKKNKTRFRQGVTLVEILVSMVALTIAVIGTSYFRYYSALDARRASIQVSGTRIGLLLCESWKGLKGSDSYDPVTHFGTDLVFTDSSTIDFSSHPITAPIQAQGFTLLGSYSVPINDVTYHAVLSWKDVDVNLRALSVVIIWQQRGQPVTGTTPVVELGSFKLTTYTSL